MWIMNQDGNKLVNTDKVSRLKINSISNRLYAYTEDESNPADLGIYDSISDSDTVLRAIMECLSRRATIFYMPPKDNINNYRILK